jgi:protein O-mannosyl-transferase
MDTPNESDDVIYLTSEKTPWFRSPGWLSAAACALIAAACLAAYSNSFSGPFIFDDFPSIPNNPTIWKLSHVGRVLSPPPHGQTVSGRPLLNLSLALNYAACYTAVGGYHATNLAIHILAALILFGVARRTFLLPSMKERYGKASIPLALAISLLWSLHPLQTESVTYIVQRAESMVSGFFLLTLYCAIRGTERSTGGEFAIRRPSLLSAINPWYATSVLFCLLGMATKEVMAAAPLIVLLYDRAFLSGSFRAALRRRWPLYICLAATWILLGWLTASTELLKHKVEQGWMESYLYARSQPNVILYYVRLCFWPGPLCLDYQWQQAPAWLEYTFFAPIAFAICATLWGLLKNKHWAFLGAWFFLFLAPSSSIVPLGQRAFEHRMYLPLAAVVALTVVSAWSLGRDCVARGRLSPRALKATSIAALIASSAALGSLTFLRNFDYRSAYSIWKDTLEKAPHSFAAYNDVGVALADEENWPEAIAHYNMALELNPQYAEAYNNLGIALAAQGHTAEAMDKYRTSLKIKPQYAAALNNLGILLADQGKLADAVAHYKRALDIRPEYPEALNNLGNALLRMGRPGEAIDKYEKAVDMKPDYAKGFNNLGNAYRKQGRIEEAMLGYRKALDLDSDYAEAYKNLGLALADLGRYDDALEQHHHALKVDPQYADAYNGIADALQKQGKLEEAAASFRKSLEIKPEQAEAHNDLGFLLSKLGDLDGAIEQYAKALELKPDFADAHKNLAVVLAGKGRIDEAVAEYRKALNTRPHFADALNNLGFILYSKGQVQEALSHWRQGLHIQPNDLNVLKKTAWVLATCHDASLRNGKEAVALAGRAVKLSESKDPSILDILAAAYAETGQFKEAIDTADKALQLPIDNDETPLADQIRSRSELYRAGSPYHERPADATDPAD